MKSIEEFFNDRISPCLSSSAVATHRNDRDSTMPNEVREAADRNWLIFPVPEFAKLAGNPDLLINQATTDTLRLEELAVQYSQKCTWRMAIGPSALYVLHLIGQHGQNSLAGLLNEREECLTLQARHGDSAWAYFRRPKDVIARASAHKLAPGVSVLTGSGSCTIVPFLNAWAEVEATPHW